MCELIRMGDKYSDALKRIKQLEAAIEEVIENVQVYTEREVLERLQKALEEK